jgi:hypothetical protein
VLLAPLRLRHWATNTVDLRPGGASSETCLSLLDVILLVIMLVLTLLGRSAAYASAGASSPLLNVSAPTAIKAVDLARYTHTVTNAGPGRDGREDHRGDPGRPEPP